MTRLLGSLRTLIALQLLSWANALAPNDARGREIKAGIRSTFRAIRGSTDTQEGEKG